jgi:lipoyl(octanoyl) transferase
VSSPVETKLPEPVLHWRGRAGYEPVWRQMQDFTTQRAADSPDEFWMLEHEPVFTQGTRGRAEHVLAAGDIPVIQTDRGGQVTYHGPGQLMVYTLLDLQRLGLGIRSLVTALEEAVMATLAGYGITAKARRDAPGVYVDDAKIASLGLRVRRGCSYHGLALNVAMDLEPFQRINPCGYRGLQVTQVSQLGGPADIRQVSRDLLPKLLERLGLPHVGNVPGQL